MTAQDWAQLKGWFVAATDAESDDAERIVRQAEDASPVLAAELRRLFAEHGSKRFHTQSVTLQQVRIETRIEGAVGPYRIQREIGRGGVGIVFLAEREDDESRRPVALKVLRYSDWDRPGQLLTAERRALAQLQHPNIATLIDWARLRKARLG